MKEVLKLIWLPVLLITLITCAITAAFLDPHDYDTEYEPRWDFSLNTVTLQPVLHHRADCHFCATNHVE